MSTKNGVAVCGDHAGFHPCTPPGALPLDPFSGNSNSYHTNSFPVEQSITQTHIRRGRLYFCELGARTADHGLGGGTPPAGCFASGENDKKEAVRECILSAALFFVFIAPVGSRSVSSSNMRKEVCSNSLLNRRTGAGGIPLPWGYRGRGAPCPVCSFMSGAEKHLCHKSTASRSGSGESDSGCRGVQGERSPCFAQSKYTGWPVLAEV